MVRSASSDTKLALNSDDEHFLVFVFLSTLYNFQPSGFYIIEIKLTYVFVSDVQHIDSASVNTTLSLVTLD